MLICQKIKEICHLYRDYIIEFSWQCFFLVFTFIEFKYNLPSYSNKVQLLNPEYLQRDSNK